MKIFKKHFFAINDLMNLAGADYQILASSSLGEKLCTLFVDTFGHGLDTDIDVLVISCSRNQ